MIGLSVLGVYSTVAKTKSLRYGPASRVSIIGYMSIVIMLLIDVVFFGTHFTED